MLENSMQKRLKAATSKDFIVFKAIYISEFGCKDRGMEERNEEWRMKNYKG